MLDLDSFRHRGKDSLLDWAVFLVSAEKETLLNGHTWPALYIRSG